MNQHNPKEYALHSTHEDIQVNIWFQNKWSICHSPLAHAAASTVSSTDGYMQPGVNKTTLPMSTFYGRSKTLSNKIAKFRPRAKLLWERATTASYICTTNAIAVSPNPAKQHGERKKFARAIHSKLPPLWNIYAPQKPKVNTVNPQISTTVRSQHHTMMPIIIVQCKFHAAKTLIQRNENNISLRN